MLSRHSLDVDEWASPAHPSPSNRVLDEIPLGIGWALDGRFQPMAWYPVPPVSPSSRGGPLKRHRVILGRLGRFVFRKPGVKPEGHVIGYQSHVVWPHRAVVWANPIDLLEA